MVTVLGVGGVTGAVYVAVLPEATAPLDCVVTTLSTPQELPLHPGPDTDHDSAMLGFEPGGGVRVAAMVAVPETGTLAGADICSKKSLVIITAAEACLDGSATLCAISVAAAGAGKICGAV